MIDEKAILQNGDQISIEYSGIQFYYGKYYMKFKVRYRKFNRLKQHLDNSISWTAAVDENWDIYFRCDWGYMPKHDPEIDQTAISLINNVKNELEEDKNKVQNLNTNI